MDVVYILGKGSLAADLEIVMSVRSLYTNMKDLRNIYVVGEEPKLLPGVEHIQHDDVYPGGWQNVYSKIKRACEIEELSEEFLLMNDDFFMVESFTGADYPFYAIKNSNGGSCGQHAFQIHAPMRINKKYFLAMPFDINSNVCKSFRSFYGNFYKAPPKFIDDVIIQTGENVEDFDIQVAGQNFFSCSNQTFLNEEFGTWLMTRFPEPSDAEWEPEIEE